MRSRVYVTFACPSVRQSVCPVQPPHAAAAGSLLCVMGPGCRRYRSTAAQPLLSSRRATAAACETNTGLFFVHFTILRHYSLQIGGKLSRNVARCRRIYFADGCIRIANIGVNSYWAKGLKPPTFMIMGLAYMTSPPLL